MQDYYNFQQAGLNMNMPNMMNLQSMQQQMMNPMNPYAAYGQSYGYVNPFGYPIGQTLPTQRVVEKMRKSKQKFAPESTRRFEDVSNSTDESIHLVRSRKIGGKLKIIYV